MEAKWLFDVDYDRIKVVIQPQSIIHSMVQIIDGSVIAQLGCPDMRLPIQYALYYPDRKPMKGERLDFAKISQISFENPDIITFRGLQLAYDAGRAGGNVPTVYNAANEFAVNRFLNKEIAFADIVDMIEKAMDSIEYISNPDVDEIIDTERKVIDILR